jgi:penicillin-binding protein 2
MEKFEKYGEYFGFGQLTNIDIPDENRGILPTMDWLTKRKYGFTRGKLVNYGIGQGEISVTPLQMAVYCAAIANGGTYYQPHIVRSIHNNITGRVEPIAFDKRKIPIDPKYFDIIQNGMFAVVNIPGGTAGNAKVDGIKVCGKTGTAQNPHGRDHAWFICFAPMDNPKIAMCVMVENSGFGAVAAAPIAQALLQAFFYPDKPLQQNLMVNVQAVPDSLQDRVSFINNQ